MEKEPSDDSYCTTDDGGNDNNDEEEPLPAPLTEKNGDEVKLKDDNVIKIIDKIGNCTDKPIEIDNVVITSHGYYVDLDTKKDVFFSSLCEFEEFEINLSDENKIPRSFALGVCSMREQEEATIKIKFKYIFKFLAKSKENFKEVLPQFFDPSFQSKYEKEKIIFKVKLTKFYMIQNLMDKGEIRKKIIIRSTDRKNNYAKNSDIVTYSLRCIYKNKEIYNREKVTSELDKEINVTMYEIEQRIIENVKPGESSMITVEPSYMTYRNKAFIEKYGIDNTEPTHFFCEVFDIQHFEYVYNVKKDKISKSKILHKGYGLESPDREMSVKFKLMIKIDGKIVFNTFEKENIEEYINEGFFTDQCAKWRDDINREFEIKNIDDEVDYEKNGKIYARLNFPNLIDCDLKMYTIPNLMRKVLIHMKRNEITYVKTSYIDYFVHNDFELNGVGQLNANTPKIELYIHLYDFLQVPSFSKNSYEDKLSLMTKYKAVADDCFKKGKLFRAMKIYNNLNYRFDEGDIFGHDRKNAEDYLKEKNPDLYNKLVTMRLATHNNYSLVKLKMGKIYTCYTTCKKVLSDYDDKNPKALYMVGKCAIEMKNYKEAIEFLTKLNEVQQGNNDAIALLNEAKRLNEIDLSKEKKMFRKMFQHSE